MKQSDFFTVSTAETEFGELGQDGGYGYCPGIRAPLAKRHLEGNFYLSAHPTSLLSINLLQPAEICGFLATTSAWQPERPVAFSVQDNPIGVCYGPLDCTRSIAVPPGEIRLRIDAGPVSQAHAVWALRPAPMPAISRLAVVTAACYKEEVAWRRLWYLSRSCQRQGLRLHPSGIGTEYRNHLHSKIIRLRKFIEKIDAEFILHSDCIDSFILAGESEILEKFAAFNTDFLISMERGCWPVFDRNWAEAFQEAPDNRRWPNAGGWMGTKDGVLRVLEECTKISASLCAGTTTTGAAAHWRQVIQHQYQDDQLLMQVLYLDGGITGDRDGQIFTNVGTAQGDLTGNEDYIFENNRPVHPSTGTQPSVIHFSGGKFEGTGQPWAAFLDVFGEHGYERMNGQQGLRF